MDLFLLADFGRLRRMRFAFTLDILRLILFADFGLMRLLVRRRGWTRSTQLVCYHRRRGLFRLSCLGDLIGEHPWHDAANYRGLPLSFLLCPAVAVRKQ